MSEQIKVVCYGLGVIGKRIIEQLLTKKAFKIVGAIDINEEIVGKDLGEIMDLGEKLGVLISNEPSKIFLEKNPQIVIHTTQSYIKQVFAQLEEIVKNGIHIVSTCEELSNPYLSSPELSERLDKLAKENNVTILGTGINPGFLMDYLPLVLTGPCRKVDKIDVIRQMNASNRRLPFQKKIGSGMSAEEFNQKMDNGIITGHVGLEQSLGMIASGLGWKLDEIEIEKSDPLISEEGVSSDFIKVEPGKVCGLTQKARGLIRGEVKITMDFRAYLGAPEEFDSITITGTPSFTQKISPCVHGDIGTVSMVINSIPRILKAPAGLILMKDLPPPIVLPQKK